MASGRVNPLLLCLPVLQTISQSLFSLAFTASMRNNKASAAYPSFHASFPCKGRSHLAAACSRNVQSRAVIVEVIRDAVESRPLALVQCVGVLLRGRCRRTGDLDRGRPRQHRPACREQRPPYRTSPSAMATLACCSLTCLCCPQAPLQARFRVPCCAFTSIAWIPPGS